MKVIDVCERVCPCCMEYHEVKRVYIDQHITFKGMPLKYTAELLYCDRADELFEDEEMMSKNDISLKDAYRKQVGLLTTDQIISIRGKYGISQSDLCLLLDWGGKTIARYEGHQVQDSGHDTILKKLDSDPAWFLELLSNSKEAFTEAAYRRYEAYALNVYNSNHDNYLKRTVRSRYARLHNQPHYTGNMTLSFEKIVDAICYFANSKAVTSLYTVKLMKLLWYSDALSFKRFGHSITGMAYQAIQMGAAPVAYDAIIDLNGVNYIEKEIGEGIAREFIPSSKKSYPSLNSEDINVLDAVISRFGGASKDEIVSAMHGEEAFKRTKQKELISFEYTRSLSLD